MSSKTAARLNRRYRDEPAGGDSYPALKDRAKLRASLRDRAAEPRENLSRRAPPVSQRLTALRAAEPQAMSNLEDESETHRTAGGGAAGELSRRAPPVSQRLTALRAAEPREGVVIFHTLYAMRAG